MAFSRHFILKIQKRRVRPLKMACLLRNFVSCNSNEGNFLIQKFEKRDSSMKAIVEVHAKVRRSLHLENSGPRPNSQYVFFKNCLRGRIQFYRLCSVVSEFTIRFDLVFHIIVSPDCSDCLPQEIAGLTYLCHYFVQLVPHVS